MFERLAEWITDVVDTVGYLGVAALIALENIFPPIPSEAVLPLAGFASSEGESSLLGMILAATAGSLVGAWVLYGVAFAIGDERLHGFVDRHGRWLGLKLADVERAETWFERRSDVAVLVGRCIPIIRSLVSIPAGFQRMPLLRFSVLTVIGSAIWNTVLISAGALLGDQWRRVADAVGVFQLVVLAIIVVLVAFFLWKRIVAPRVSRIGERSDDTGHGGTPPHAP